jgi:hypothetical protein
MSMQEIFSPPNRLTSGYKYPTMAEVEPRLELGLQMLFLSRAHRLSLLALVPQEDEQRKSCLLCYSTSPEFLRAGQWRTQPKIRARADRYVQIQNLNDMPV